MIKKLKNILMSLVLATGLVAPGTMLLAPVSVLAASDACTSNIGTGINDGINGATGAAGSNCTGTDAKTSITNVAKTVVNYLSIIVGVIAVIMIIVGGFKYITSGGDSSHVSGAKNTLIYAIVGLLIVALAQFIVHFVLSGASTVNQ